MPQTTDYSKGPFDFIGCIESGIKGEWEKMVQQGVSGITFSAYAYGRYFSSEATQKVWRTEVKLLWWAWVYISSLQLLFIDASSCGSQYKTAAERFDDADYALSNASAASSWTGDAAEAYNNQNDLQQARVQTMSSLDTEIAAILAKESDQVERNYQTLSDTRTMVQVFIILCMYLNASDPALSGVIQRIVFLIAISIGTGTALAMVDQSGQHAKQIKARIGEYSAVASDAATSLAQLTGGSAAANAAAAAASFVTKFDDLTDAARDKAAEIEAEIATWTEESGDDADSRFDGLFPNADRNGDGEGSGDDGQTPEPSEDESATPEPEVASTYSFAGLGEALGRASGSKQAARSSLRTASQAGLGRRTIGAAEQLGSMASSASTGSAGSEGAPAEEAVVDTGVLTDVEGAAAGTEDAERAPIDSATGGSEQSQRGALSDAVRAS